VVAVRVPAASCRVSFARAPLAFFDASVWIFSQRWNVPPFRSNTRLGYDTFEVHTFEVHNISEWPQVVAARSGHSRCFPYLA
jgi:hypothetical protein